MITIQFRICTHTRMWRITTLLRYPTIHLPTTSHSPFDLTFPWISHSPGSHSLGSNNPGSAHSPVDLITTTITSLLSQYSGSVSRIKSPYKPPVLYPHSLLDLLILLDRLSFLDLQSSGLHSSRSTHSSGSTLHYTNSLHTHSFHTLYNEWYITNHWSGCLQGTA